MFGRSRRNSPVAAFQILISPPRDGSPPPVASNLPSLLKASAVLRSANGEGPSLVPRVRSGFHMGSMSRAATARSAAAEITSPAGAKINAPMAAECAATISQAAPFSADQVWICLLYTSDAADERSSVDLGGRRIIKK